MFTYQNDSSEYLYHYTNSQIAIDFILQNKNLRLSSYTKTNDPKETKNWFFIAGSNEGQCLDQYTQKYLSSRLNPVLKDSTRVLCFSTDQKLTGNQLQDLPKRGFCKPRMWAQYGENHQGVCLIFNRKRFTEIFFEKYKKHTYSSGDVAYSDRLISDIQQESAFIVNVDYLEKLGADEYAVCHRQKYIKRLYFEKALDWANENEYRFVLFDCPNETFIEYENSLVGIVFGQDCSDDNEARIRTATKGHNLQFQRLNWRNCTPWLTF